MYDYIEAGEAPVKLEEGVYLERLRFGSDIPFSDSEEIAEIFGDPEKDALVWEKGSSQLSDSIMCEKYITEVLTANDSTEEAIMERLEKHGSFDRTFGCVQSDVGWYAESLGLHVSLESDLTMKDICEALDNNEKIICAVSSITMSYPEISDMPGLHGDSYMEIIGVDETVSGKKNVIVNDPNASCGGIPYDMETFLSAWGKSGRFAVIINKVGE